jgi:hydrophobe/amphiphile efflux-1 (HAE1) family protein
MLGIYAALLASAGWLLMNTPTGFIPKMDRGIITVSIQLPQGASLQRTDEVVRRANKIVLETPGVAHTSTYTGRSATTGSNSSNLGAIFAVMADPDERAKKHLPADKIADDLMERLGQIEESKTSVTIPPPVRGMGGQTGFSMRLQNRANLTPAEFEKVGNDFIAAANKQPDLKNVFTTFSTGTPQLYVDVDRNKAQMLNVPLEEIFEALRVYLGSAYVNDFNMFGRTFRVTAQADANFRIDPENVARIRVRNQSGQMVPLGNLVNFRHIAGPDRVPRYNLFPTIEVNGSIQPGVSTGQAIAIMADLAKAELPEGITYEWTDLSYQETKVGGSGYYIFILSVVFVFLTLAAQFESWSMPLAIILIVPMCLLSALFGVSLHGQDINILTQIGFVVLIGLAAKNAILIVEFARQLEDRGRDTVTAAVEAAKLRLRPILMTSLAFTLGVVPLYIASGAGAEMRIALGTGVFWGMIGVTVFGLIFTPVFYVVVRKASKRRSSTAHAATVPAECSTLEVDLRRRQAILPAVPLKLRIGVLFLRPADAQVGDELPGRWHIERGRHDGRFQDRHPSDTETVCARGEPQRLDGGDDGVAQRLRHGLAAQSETRVGLLIREHREMHGRCLETFELQARVEAAALVGIAFERVGVGAREGSAHRVPAAGALHQHEPPRLAVADRRRVRGKSEQGGYERRVDGVGLKSAHVTAP